MAVGNYTASTLKYSRKYSTSSGEWRSDNIACQGKSDTYDSNTRIGYIGFNFDMTGKVITNIVFKGTSNGYGIGSWFEKTLGFYKCKNASATNPLGALGDPIGDITSNNLGTAGTVCELTFNSSSNSSIFDIMKSYFEAGNNVLMIYNPDDTRTKGDYDDDGDTEELNYTDCYLGFKAVELEITYIDTFYFDLDILLPNGDEPYDTGAAGSVEMSVNGGDWVRVYNEPQTQYPCGTSFRFKNFLPKFGLKLSSVSGADLASSGEWHVTQQGTDDVAVSFYTSKLAVCHVKNNGEYKEGVISAKVGGAYRECDCIYRKVNGAWVLV